MKIVFKCEFNRRCYDIQYSESLDVYFVRCNGSVVCDFYSCDNAFELISNLFDDYLTGFSLERFDELESC